MARIARRELRAAFTHLGRHVRGRAAEGGGAVVERRHRLLRQPEVGEADVALGVEQDVLGLEVAVDDVVAVELLQREHDLGAVQPHAPLVEGALAPQVEEELAARLQRHHEVQLLAALERVVHRDDERVAHALQHVALGERVLHLVAHHDVRLLHHLHRVQVARRLLAHLHHLAVRAAPDHAQQLKVRGETAAPTPGSTTCWRRRIWRSRRRSRRNRSSRRSRRP